MDKSIKKEARRQYFSYFKVWFIIIGVLFVVFLGASFLKMVGNMVKKQVVSQSVNTKADEVRVYDYADVLTNEEEQELSEHIAKKEAQYKIHFAVVTINEDVESQGDWENVMLQKADVFYDQHKYGYDKAGGDGTLLLDNWYTDQAGSKLLTSGVVYEKFNDYEVDEVLDEVYYYIEHDPYKAYMAFVDMTCEILDDPANTGEGADIQIPWIMVLGVPTLVAFIFAMTNLNQKKAQVTVNNTTYVAGGKPVMRAQDDTFLRKNVITRRIETSSGSRSGGSRRSGGGGGSYRSSSGASRGGGSRRR